MEENLKTIAYKKIKQNIIECIYPPASFLNESALMTEIGASRTPIREALNRLEQEGLVRILPKKGVYVSDLSIKEIFMLYETRFLVEPYAVRTYGRAISHDKLLKLRVLLCSATDSADETLIFQEDDKFHSALIESTGNKYLIKTMDHIYDQNQRLRIWSGTLASIVRLRQSNDEHMEIIDSLLKGDADRAAQGVLTHLKNSQEISMKAVL